LFWIVIALALASSRLSVRQAEEMKSTLAIPGRIR